MECIICFQQLDRLISWSNFFSGIETTDVCQECERKLKKISGPRCTRCSRYTKEEICSDCRKWERNGGSVLEFNYSIYAYNDFMKEVIAKWKYRGDYKLADAFAADFKAVFLKEFAHVKDALLVPIPLSEQRLEERAFNQAEQLASYLPAKTAQLLVRKHSEKQAKKSRAERIRSKNPFSAKGPIYNPVILVDDIYTTGTTVQHAAFCLKKQGCPAVYSYTLIRG